MTLQFWDYVCILGYLGLVVVLGSCFAGQQKTTRNYFLAGKSMGWLPLAISMYATLFSSLSYVMGPAEAFRYDLQYFMALIMFPVASLFAIVLFIDFYLRLGITTIYQYVDARFNPVLSVFVLLCYMLFRCLYAGIVVFAVSMVLHVTMGIPLRPTMVGVGILAIVYTTLGGMKAVIWTDVAQFFVLFGGLVAALGFAVSHVPGGFAEVWRIAADDDKLRLVNPAFDLHARYVIWTLIPFGFVEYLGAKTVDQMNVQRYLSARSARDAKMSMFVTSFFTMPVWALLFGVGMCLYAYYTVYPSPVVAEFIENGHYDRIFPHYIFSVMPTGLRGLMIAALLASAMSTMDSVLNVLSTISVVNLYRRYVNRKADDHRSLVLAKMLTVAWGVVIIGLALSMINIQSILEAINTVTGMLIGPIVGVFITGMFVRRANWQGTLIGLLLSFLPVLYLRYATDITFTVYGITGLTCSVVLSSLISLLFPAPPARQVEGLMTWKWHGLREMLLGGVAADDEFDRAATDAEGTEPAKR